MPFSFIIYPDNPISGIIKPIIANVRGIIALILNDYEQGRITGIIDCLTGIADKPDDIRYLVTLTEFTHEQAQAVGYTDEVKFIDDLMPADSHWWHITE